MKDIEKKLRNEISGLFDVEEEKAKFLFRLKASYSNLKPLEKSEYLTVQTSKRPAASLLCCASLLTTIIVSSFSLKNSPSSNPVSRYSSPFYASLKIEGNSQTSEKEVPEFDLTIDTDGKVTKFIPLNTSARIVVGSNTYYEEEFTEAALGLIDLSTNTGYLARAATAADANRISIAVSGQEKDAALAKTTLSNSVRYYLKQNKIFAYLVDEATTNSELEEQAALYGLSVEKYSLLVKLNDAYNKVSETKLETTISRYKNKTIEELTELVAEVTKSASNLAPVLSAEEINAAIKKLTDEYRGTTDSLYVDYRKTHRQYRQMVEQIERMISRERCQLDERFDDDYYFDYITLEDIYDWFYEDLPFIPPHRNFDEITNDFFGYYRNDYGDEDWWGNHGGPGNNRVCSQEILSYAADIKTAQQQVEQILADLEQLSDGYRRSVQDLLDQNKDDLKDRYDNMEEYYQAEHDRYYNDYKDKDDRDEDFFYDFDRYFDDFYYHHSFRY